MQICGAMQVRARSQVYVLQLRVDSRWHPSRSAILDMACPPASAPTLGVKNYTSSAPMVYVSSQNNEVALYDLRDVWTRQLFRAWTPQPDTQAAAPLGPPGRDVSDVKQATLPAQRTQGFRALLPLPAGPLICGGSDMCIRYIHGREPARSCIVCGPLQPHSSKSSGPDVRYSHHMEGSCGVICEDIRPAQPQRDPGEDQVAKERAYRRLLAQSHRDCITAMAIANLQSGPVLVSASRDGMIKAWR